MKTTKIIIASIALLFSMSFTQAQKVQTVDIQTSANCEHCKETIVDGLTFHKGIKALTMDMDTKVLTVRFNSKKTTLDAIRQKIASLGYSADAVPAQKEAFDKLAPCCKKGGVCTDDMKKEG